MKRCDICGHHSTRRCGHIARDGQRCPVRLCELCIVRQPKGPFVCPTHVQHQEVARVAAISAKPRNQELGA